MIVEAFKDTLELGLQKPEQIVVSPLHRSPFRTLSPRRRDVTLSSSGFL